MIPMWLVACATYPLSDVPIVGGTAEQREVVQRTVDHFDDAVGPGRVELHVIRIVESNQDWRGRYRGASQTIDISDATGSVVRHELGHALVHQQELDVLDPEPMSEVVSLLF